MTRRFSDEVKELYEFAGIFFLAVLVLMVFVLPLSMAQQAPTGATVTELRSERAPADTPNSHDAFAGNVTELTISGVSTTQSWQGYFGNVSGTLQLADASDNVLYNWSLADPEGEVYASINESIVWGAVQCFNFTSTGTLDFSGEVGGQTSLNGTNLSQLENTYNISFNDVDGVNETFNATQAGGFQHDGFFVGDLEFIAGECPSVTLYSDAGESTAGEFEEVLLYDANTTSVVFASILEEADTLGFDNANHDFEMIVLENGHGTDTSATPYYFYVEIQ